MNQRIVFQENACLHVEGLPNFMASPQCLGYTHYRKLTKEICFPSRGEILNRTKAIVESIKASSVYVATDNDPMLSDLKATLLKYKVYKLSFISFDLSRGG